MSTFPYVDISHKKIWRPLSTGRYVDPTLFLFIYFAAVSLPPWPAAALCANGAGPAGTPAGRGPARRGGRAGGLRVRAALPPPRSPLLPLPVTLRRTGVAGSMTPWVEAASALVAAGGCGRPRELPAGGRAGARRRPPRPAQVAGRPRGGPAGRGAAAGGGWRWPRCPPPAGPRPRPPLPAEPTLAPGAAAGAGVRPARERFIFVGVAASLWLPRDLVSSPLPTCPFPGRCAGGCGDGEERKVGNQ